MRTYDAIVVGLGGIGSAALYHLASRGASVLGIDRFAIGHDRGSSHGQTRIIRQAYFEHPNYVPLVLRAFDLWAELESRHGRPLFHRVGLLQVGPPDGEVIPGVLASAKQYRLDVEQLEPADIAARWPGIRIPDVALWAVFERAAGYLEVENCVRAHFQEALKLGAVAHLGAEVLGWQADGPDLVVSTASSQFRTRRLVIAAGAWSGRLVTELKISLQVIRKPMFWFECRSHFYERKRCPCFLFEMPDGEFYGFPGLEPYGVKIAEHTGGDQVVDPSQLDRELDAISLHRVEEFAARCLPQLGNRLSHHAVCMYTMSPDKHFILDRHPEHSNVSFVAGLSGHGFKFAPVLGEALADLALHGTTLLPVEFLRAARLQSTLPNP